MLTQLTIKNYALIKHLEFNPSGNLNVITGETGAGKSIMLGAMGLLLGNRADSKTLWDENEKCVTEGIFDISAYSLKELFEAEHLDYEAHTVIRREISPAGKSRAFINDTPVTLDVMRKVGSHLMDIHSQHETLELGNKSFQVNLIDSYAGNQELKGTYSVAWKNFCVAEQTFNSLKEESIQLKKESDFVSFQLDELVKADLQIGELEKLESDLKISEHAEEIKTQFNLIIDQLDKSEFSVNSALLSIRNQLQSVANYSEEYSQLLKRIESTRIELDDILQEIENAEEKIEFDPQQAEEIKDRVGLIYHLQQKHRLQHVDQLIALQEELQIKADKTNNLDDLLKQAKENLAKAEKELTQSANALSKSRQKNICSPYQTTYSTTKRVRYTQRAT
jgi:DNA repair protein RecN (Recombination protein N)